MTVEILPGLIRAFIRALLIVAACLPVALAMRPTLCHDPRRSGWIWALLLLPWLTPALLTGYGYYSYSLSLIHYPVWNEILYCLLIAMKVLPVAAAVLCVMPESMSPSAVHCHRLLASNSKRHAGLLLTLRSHATGLWAAGAAVFLLAFSDFDMAALMTIPSWTVHLFDQQTGGLPIKDALELAVIPVLCKAIVLATALVLIMRTDTQPLGQATVVRGRRRTILVLCLSAIVVAGIPGAVVLRGTPEGIGTVFANFAIARSLLAAVAFAGIAVGLATFGAKLLRPNFMLRFKGWRPALRLIAVPLIILGLLGPLLVSLLLLALLQHLGIQWLYDSPLPLLLALTILLFPFAYMLRLLMDRFTDDSAIHTARLLGDNNTNARRLLWALHTRREFWVAFILFIWAYSNVVAAAILAPTWGTPVFVVLYNLMHYGQTAVMSAMVCVVVAVPLALLAVGAGGNCLITRRSVR
jgi:hypothetical protein